MTPQDSPEARIAEIRDELVRRACEGCEGSLDKICTRATLVKRVWCDPCRCQEGAKSIDVLSRRLHEQAHEIERLKVAQRVWDELSVRVSCSSPDGSAELEQVQYAYERAEAAESALAAAQREIERLQEAADDLRCEGRGHTMIAELTKEE